MGNSKCKPGYNQVYQCPESYDDSFNHDDLPPPAPPNGREDLWDLQFCRWWGWNWVRRKEVEGGTTSGARREEEVKPGRRTRPRNCERKTMRPELRNNYEPDQCRRQPMRHSRHTTSQFREMCSCLLGKTPKPHGGMANLYNTPSCSVMALEKVSCPTENPTKIQRTRKKCTQGKCDEDQAQSWSKAPANEELGNPSSVENICERLSCQKNASSTEESIEYLSFRVQHIKSDMCCPCRQHSSPPTKQKKAQQVPRGCSLQTQTSVPGVQDHKETQTFTQVVNTTRPGQQRCPCDEKTFKLKGKHHKTICICVCCCGTCKPTNKENGISNKCCENTKTSLKSVEKEIPCRDRKVCINSANRSTKSDGSNNYCTSYGKDYTMTYPLIVPPSNTKMLSKFGTPSKNYHWMENITSDATTATLNNLETFKSPASGKTYEFATTCNIDSYDKCNLPELIDISDELSYLKKLESTTNKTDNENRVLLDAVCDAILKEHDQKSLQFLNECHLQNTYNDAFNMDYKELELLCDLQNKFPSKSEVNTELSKAFLNEDVGLQLTKPSNMDMSSDPNIKFGDIGGIKDVIDNFHVEKNEACIRNPEPFKSRQTEPCFKFQGVDKKNDVFTRTGLLPPRSMCVHKKTIKREASNSCKGEKISKKLKHEEGIQGNKVNNPEHNNMNTQCAEQTTDKIGTIFNKIEDIVKQSKVKSAEIQKVLNIMPPKREASYECSESVLETHSLGQNASTSDFQCGKITGRNANCMKRNYKMSSDSFLKGIYPLLQKTDEEANIKKSYECFSDNLDHILDEYANYPGVVPEIIFEEDATSGQEINNSENQKESVKSIQLEKVSKLSTQSFIVCDEKSPVVHKPHNDGAKTEKKTTKNKKKKGSLIPIRKQSSTAGEKS